MDQSSRQLNLNVIGFSNFPNIPDVVGPFDVFDARRALVNARFDDYGGASRDTLDAFTEFLLSRGLAEPTAREAAFQAVSRLLEEQAQILSFIDSFELMAFIFVALAPLILLMKRPVV